MGDKRAIVCLEETHGTDMQHCDCSPIQERLSETAVIRAFVAEPFKSK